MAGYEFFYPGTKYGLDASNDAFVGYQMKAGELGMTGDPRTAAALQDASMKLNTGIKTIEIEGVSPEIFESIPQQHLQEINRLSKLTGTDVTLHGPLVEASGFGRENWSETNRQSAERQIELALQRAHELNPNGNIPVTFHSTAQLPEMMEKMKTDEGEKAKSMWIIDPRTGNVASLKETEKHFPGQEGAFDPKRELKTINDDRWVEQVNQINIYVSRAEDALHALDQQGQALKNPEAANQDKTFKAYAEARKNPEQFDKMPEEMKADMENKFRYIDHASMYLSDSYRSLRELYNTAYNNVSPEDKKKLEAYKEKIADLVTAGKGIEKEPEKLKQFAEVIQDGFKVLKSIDSPQVYRPLNEFIIGKSAETFGEAALESYKKFGNTAPMVCIENPPGGSGLSRAEDLRNLVEKSRQEFVKQATENGDLSKSEAKEAAEKLIGATWDVGHINMIRKFGYDDKDIIKETEKIAPFVKHVHLSDNFGFEHTELPMGMGNVPIKEIMEKLGKAGFEGKKIVEAASWWQHMKTAPVIPTMEAFGSPLYPMLAQQTWTQAAGTVGNYFAFPSSYLPEQHFSLYGGGFSGLPQELGGQIPGKQSRVSGTPMS